MKTSHIFLIGAITCLGIYLFANRPALLPNATQDQSVACTYDTREVFGALNGINDAARAIYTKEIVGGGLKAGLKFGEDWDQPGVDKGPLPALFLRLTAARLEAKPPPVGLFLGSDAPINASNLFVDAQAASFETVKATRAPLFSGGEEGARLVAMYPDIASVAPCVTCHNDHPDSPKKDWKLDDVMGATTWTYPSASMSASHALAATDAMLASVSEAYQRYLDKAAGFSAPVPLGGWPEAGQRQLPTVEIFMAKVQAEVAPLVFQDIILRRKAIDFNKEYKPCSQF